jgi:hypothetical protein
MQARKANCPLTIAFERYTRPRRTTLSRIVRFNSSKSPAIPAWRKQTALSATGASRSSLRSASTRPPGPAPGAGPLKWIPQMHSCRDSAMRAIASALETAAKARSIPQKRRSSRPGHRREDARTLLNEKMLFSHLRGCDRANKVNRSVDRATCARRVTENWHGQARERPLE